MKTITRFWSAWLGKNGSRLWVISVLIFMVRKLMMVWFKDYPFISNRTPGKKWENREERPNPGGRGRQDPSRTEFLKHSHWLKLPLSMFCVLL